MSLSELGGGTDHDWKGRYESMKALLEETRKELDEFQQSSQELEDEMEAELKRTEATQKTLLKQVATLEEDAEQWKRRYKQAIADATRWETEYEKVNRQLHETSGKVMSLEMDNDDLERAQRVAAAGLQYKDEEVERLILERDEFSEELSAKDMLEQENHRLKVELQEMTEEVSVLQSRLLSSTSVSTVSPVISLNTSTSTSATSTSGLSMVEPITPKSAPFIAPTEMTASTTTKGRFLGRIRRPSAVQANDRHVILSQIQPDQPREHESRGLKLVSDMRARTKALQAKIGAANLPVRTRVRVESLAASTSKFGARARQSLGSNIKRKESRTSMKANAEMGRQSMDVRSSLDTTSSSSTRPSMDSTASAGWDSLSDIVPGGRSATNATPRGTRTRAQPTGDTIRPPKTSERPSVGSVNFNLGPVSEVRRPRQSSNASRHMTNQKTPPSSFRLSTIDGFPHTSTPSVVPIYAPHSTIHDQNTPPPSTSVRLDNTATSTSDVESSSQIKGKAERPYAGGIGIGIMKHKRSATLDRLGEGWANGWKPTGFALGRRVKPPRSSTALSEATSSPSTLPIGASNPSELLESSSSLISQLPARTATMTMTYDGLPSTNGVLFDSMIAFKSPMKNSRVGREDAKTGVVEGERGVDNGLRGSLVPKALASVNITKRKGGKALGKSPVV
ncbi:NADH:ubiquinone oxidoreductase [Tulasnella sp. JGI-2019a]|nr:NADH:ubiquinone oxidoreductase [Tulasnella sp. JGI-2019a]